MARPSSDELMGTLPAQARPWRDALAEYHVALAGDPEVLRQADTVLGEVRSGVADRVGEMRTSSDALLTGGDWIGEAAEVFAESSGAVADAAGDLAPDVQVGQMALQKVDAALSGVTYEMENVLVWFGDTVRDGQRQQAEWLASLPPVHPWYAAWYRAAAARQADSWLRGYIAYAGRSALRKGGVLEARLNEELRDSTDLLRHGAPEGMLPALARRFSSDFRSSTTVGGIDLTFDRSFLNWIGVRDRDPWDTTPGLSIEPDGLTSALIGMPASWTFMSTVQGFPWKNAAVRMPANFVNDLLNLGGLNADGTRIHPFENPAANAFASRVASASASVLLDQGLRLGSGYFGGYDVMLGDDVLRTVPGRSPWGNVVWPDLGQGAPLSDEAFAALPPSQREAILRGSLKPTVKTTWPANTGLHPVTLGSMPFTIWGTTALSDRLVREPSPLDPNNNQYYANLAADSAAIGAGVALPIAVQTASWQDTAKTFTIVTGQNAFAKFLTETPPHPDGDLIWNVGGLRPGIQAGVSGVDYVDWKLQRGVSPSDGFWTNTTKALKNADTTAYRVVQQVARTPHPLVSWALRQPWQPPDLGTAESWDRATAAAGEAAEDAGRFWSHGRLGIGVEPQQVVPYTEREDLDVPLELPGERR